MNALDLLTTRRSSKQLTEPAPDDAQLGRMLQAATQVPDHGLLTPFRFVVIRGEAALARFRETLLKAADDMALGEDGLQKAKRVGSMAPVVIGVVAALKPDNPVPEWEQLLTAGCAAYAIQLAAAAQGFDNVWISGKWVDSEALRSAFACTAHDKIIALLPVGTARTPASGEKNTDLAGFVQYW
ncbi:MAG: nitroreductase family protein [Cardiobacteriaceae bacterium]|nr:nitroreductase family protein [Cardiobacteriaceae bacterium]